MLTNIKLKNFKCFERLDLDCRPLNLLCGLNGTGKSSVLQALLVLRQSFEAGKLRDGELLLSGELIDLGQGDDVLFEYAEGISDKIIKFGAGGFSLQDDGTADAWKLEFDLGGLTELVSVRDCIRGFNCWLLTDLLELLALLNSADGPTWSDFLSNLSGKLQERVAQLDSTEESMPEELREVLELPSRADRSIEVRAAIRGVLTRIFSAPPTDDWRWEIRLWLEYLLKSNDVPPIDYMPSEWQKFPPFGGNLIYVSAERIGPQKLYPLSEVKALDSDFGDNSEYALSYLNFIDNIYALEENDPRLIPSGDTQTGTWWRPLTPEVVNQWLQDISPGVQLQLEEETESLIARFSFDRPGDERTRLYRAPNVGFGLSYVLPVVLALLAEPGTLCLIENPESHLHPRGQTKLGELAARAAKAGVQVFVETHSDHFMDGVRIAVRDGLIAPEDVAFHYFERQGGKAVVSSPQVDADGRLSEWPAGFFDQHEENLMRLLAPRP